MLSFFLSSDLRICTAMTMVGRVIMPHRVRHGGDDDDEARFSLHSLELAFLFNRTGRPLSYKWEALAFFSLSLVAGEKV